MNANARPVCPPHVEMLYRGFTLLSNTVQWRHQEFILVLTLICKGFVGKIGIKQKNATPTLLESVGLP